MDELSAPADDGMKMIASSGAGQVVVAAVNPQESRWFLGPPAQEMAQRLQFSFLDLAGRGGRQTAAELEALNPEVLVTCWSTPALSERWIESDGCRLRYVCHLTGSVRHVVPRMFIERGGLVTNWGSLPSGPVAEHALLLCLAALRNLPRWKEVFAGPDAAFERMERLQVRTLLGRRVGIHGFGRIAATLVRLLAPFGVSVTAFSSGVPADMFARAGVQRAATLRDLFAESEVVFECEALTEASRNSVGAAELAALRTGGVFVNVARGGLVAEDALLREAWTGRIRVALDVFAAEPLPPNSPWLRIPGVVLSPHIAGPTFDQYALCTRVALANIQRFLEKRPLEFVVTAEIYDRST